MTPLDRIGEALRRLERQGQTMPPSLELAPAEDGTDWTALIMADPLRRPLAGRGGTPAAAIANLAANVAAYDWRRVRR